MPLRSIDPYWSTCPTSEGLYQISHIQAAFEAVCKNARQPELWYVVLLEDCPYYGGPEEGGWWGSDTIVRAYQAFPTKEQAESARKSVETLAKELTQQSRKVFGDYCLRSMEWLDERGLDANYLPEPDGESEYQVIVTDSVPSNSYGSRGYE